MKNQTFNFEIKDLLTQFVAAFDDVIISRYDSNRNIKEKIEVRYVLAPKQRVMYDIVNKNHNLTLPVVAVNVTGVSRDNNRVFNKINNIYNTLPNNEGSLVKMPVPINIEVSMSILARYMQDMDQILSNFVPFNNPYIIISWKEPSDVTGQEVEIRSEVLWSGNISLNEPTDIASSEKFRIVADTSFTIKGWLFKNKNETSSPIYYIDNNFYTVRNFSTSLEEYAGDSEIFTLSGTPSISEIFYYTDSNQFKLNSPITIDETYTNKFLLYGKNFNYTTGVYLSTNSNLSLTNTLCTVSTKRTGSFTGFKILSSDYTILNDNILSITPPLTNLAGSYKINFIVNNDAGFASITGITS